MPTAAVIDTHLQPGASSSVQREIGAYHLCPEEPNRGDETAVFALLLDKSAIGIYTSYERAEHAWETFRELHKPVNTSFAIKTFTLDGPALIYQPY